MFEDIKVSVITPVYNDAKYVEQTIRSVLNQTHQNIELLIIDDCSSDNTIDLVNSLNDGRIRILNNSHNRGPAFCRNVGIKNATGDYIAFLDGDDIWLKEKIDNQLDFMIRNHYDFCCTKYGTIDEEGNELKKYYYSPKIIDHKRMIKCSYVGCLTVMYKRSVYPNLRIPDDILKRNDYALWLRLSERTNCYFYNQTTAFYRIHTSNHVSSGRKMALIKHHTKMFISLYGYKKSKARFYAFRNAFNYFFKRLFYCKHR